MKDFYHVFVLLALTLHLQLRGESIPFSKKVEKILKIFEFSIKNGTFL